MTKLIRTPNIADCDRFYEVLMDMHRDLDGDASSAFNARLILILANHIGEPGILEEAMNLARETGRDMPG